MATGRPPATIPDEKAVELAQDLVRWTMEEGKDDLLFVTWYYGKHKLFVDDWKALIKRDEFRPYYNVARRNKVAYIVNSGLQKCYVMRYMALYDKDLCDHEEELKDRDAERNSKKNAQVNPELVQQMDAYMAAQSARYAAVKQLEQDKASEANHTDSQA